MTTAEAIIEECNAIQGMLLDKNRKYGDSALSPVRVFSRADTIEQINVRIDDKLSRIRSGQADDDEDAEKDLIGYLILKRVARKRTVKQDLTTSPPFPEDGDDDPAEAAYWRFDARRKGYAEWKGLPMSERDAFKAEMRRIISRQEAMARDASIGDYTVPPFPSDSDDDPAVVHLVPDKTSRATTPDGCIGSLCGVWKLNDSGGGGANR